jgi:hypothetical protein
MPFPGAPKGFRCNARKQHNPDIQPCMCSSCLRAAEPGLMEGAPVQLHKDFPIDSFVGLYDASAVVEDSRFCNRPPSVCCFKAEYCTCDEPAEWNVWRDCGDPNEVVIGVCSEHLSDVLGPGRNVVWPEPITPTPTLNHEIPSGEEE